MNCRSCSAGNLIRRANMPDLLDFLAVHCTNNVMSISIIRSIIYSHLNVAGRVLWIPHLDQLPGDHLLVLHHLHTFVAGRCQLLLSCSFLSFCSRRSLVRCRSGNRTDLIIRRHLLHQISVESDVCLTLQRAKICM